MNFFLKNLLFLSFVIQLSLQAMPFLFDLANPYAFNLPIEQAYLQPPNSVLVRFVGTEWIILDKSLAQSSPFTFNNQDIGTARMIGTSKLNGLNEGKNKIFILNIGSTSIQYTITAFSNIIFSQQVYLSSNLNWIVVTLSTTIYSYNVLNNSTGLKYTLTGDQFVAEVYFNDTMSFIGTNSGKVYKKVMSTNSTDFNITLQLLYQHSSQVEELFIDNGLNLVSQDINLVLKGYDVNSSSNVTFDSSFSSKRLSQITYINSVSYFIFYTTLLQVSYNSTSHAYTTISVLQNNITVGPLHAVALDVKTNQIPFGYVTDSNLIYKFNPCTGNSNYKNSQDKCLSITCSGAGCSCCSLASNLCSNCAGGYNVQNGTCFTTKTCYVSNCLACEFSTVCSTCSTNYKLSIFGQCQLVIQNTTTNSSSNSTLQSNSSSNSTSNQTLQSNSSSNSSQTNSSSNSTLQSNSSSNSTSNQTLQSNSSSNSSQTNSSSNSTLLSNFVQSINKTTIKEEIQSLSQSVQILINSASQMNSISSFRYFLAFLMPFFEFFDDYWYYIYHQINYQNLSSLKTFFCIMYQVNNQRLLPGFINVNFANTIAQNLNNYVGNNYSNYTNVNVLNIDQNQRYFLVNCQNLFIFQYFIVIITFLFVKLILHLMILSDKNSIQLELKENPSNQQQQKLYQLTCMQRIKISLQKYLKSKTLSRMLISAFIQSNLIFLMFTSSSQLSSFFSFRCIDKISQSLSLFFLFSCLIFGICFYILTQHNIQDKKNNQYSSVMFQTLTLGAKNILNGFIHGMFLQNNTLQIFLLILVKIFLICILIKIGKKYKSKLRLALTILYYLFGLVLDVILLLNQLFQTSSPSFSHIDLICLTAIGGMIIIILLLVMVQIFIKIIQFLSHQKNRNGLKSKHNANKVQPIIQSKNNSNELQKKQVNTKHFLNLKFKIQRPTFNNFSKPVYKHPFFSNQSIMKKPKQIKTIKDSNFDFKNQLKIVDITKYFTDGHQSSNVQIQKNKNMKMKTIKKKSQHGEQHNKQEGSSIQTILMNQNEKKTWKGTTFKIEKRYRNKIEKKNSNKE